MRNFIIAASCLALVVFAWACFDNHAAEKTDYYEKELHLLITEYVNKEQWEDSKTYFDEIQNDWDEYKQIASFFLDSEELSHIDNTFKKVHYYISADDRSNSSGELAYLIGLFKTLDKKESICIENIF